MAKKGSGAAFASGPRILLLLFASFLAAAFARQCFLYALFLAGLQIKRVPLDLLDDILLLHFTLKTPKCIF